MPTRDVGTCILFEPKLRGGSEIPLRYRSVVRLLGESAYDLLGVDPLGLRREGGDHAMREHGDGHRVDIFEPDHVKAEQGNARPWHPGSGTGRLADRPPTPERHEPRRGGGVARPGLALWLRRRSRDMIGHRHPACGMLGPDASSGVSRWSSCSSGSIAGGQKRIRISSPSEGESARRRKQQRVKLQARATEGCLLARPEFWQKARGTAARIGTTSPPPYVKLLLASSMAA